MPQNFRHLGLIREALPEAVLILCHRDPRDTAVHTASITQVRQPIHRNSVAAWRRYERELAPFIRALGDDSTGTDPAT